MTLDHATAYDLADVIARTLLGNGLPPLEARTHALWICEGLAEHFGPGRIYIPAPQTSANSDRDRRIRKAYKDGATVAQLAERFAISERRVRQIIAG